MIEWLTEFLGFQLFVLGGTPVTTVTVLTAATVVLIAYWLSWIIQRAIVRTLKIRGVEREGAASVVRRLLHYLIMIAGLGIALGTIGIDVGALFAAGAFFAVAVGLAMQNIAQNFLSGVILLVERTIEPGDILEVDGSVVRVLDVGIRATIVRTLDDEELIVPNAVLVQNTVKNYTLKDSLCRLRVDVGVVYSSDMKLVFETLQRVATNLPWRHPSRDPRVMMTGFGDNAVSWQVSVWTDNPWEMLPNRSKLFQAIWWELKAMGIIIAFPQLDVHFDQPLIESFDRLVLAAGGKSAPRE